MLWLIFAIIGYISFAIIFILDKIIVSKKLSRPVVYTFYSTIFMFVALFALPSLGFPLLVGVDWLWALVSGVSFGFGLWTLFIALKNNETTHISPFNGAFVTVFVYFFSNLFLGEQITGLKQVAVIILICSALLLSFEKTRKSVKGFHVGFHVGFLWAILSGLFFAISHVSAKYLYGIYPFWTAFIWSRASTGLVGLFTLFFPAVYLSFKKKHKQTDKINKNKHVAVFIIIDKLLSVVGVVSIQYAIAIGSVTVVNALIGVQYIFMFLFVFLLTKFYPKVFREYFVKKELFIEVVAILLVVVSTALFVF
ncbi:MAG: EamA family transporter [Candidatus Magasanikbacteria bacterium]